LSAAVFTAAQIALALGCTPQRARQLMVSAANPRRIDVRGQQATAWAVADFPPHIRERLAGIARAELCRNVEHLLESKCAPWKPEIPMAEIDSNQILFAQANRDVLAPVLRAGGYAAKVSDLVMRAMNHFPDLNPRTVRRWIETAKTRDRMREEWERVELYLDEKLKRKANNVAGRDGGFLGVPGIVDLRSLWQASCIELRSRIAIGETPAAAKKAILSAVKQSPIAAGRSAGTLRKALDRKWERFCTAGDLTDKRETNGRAATVQISEREKNRLRALRLKTESTAMAVEMFADDPACSLELRDFISRERGSRHNIPLSLRQACYVISTKRPPHGRPWRPHRETVANAP
jgi:hypothetical protein